MEGDNDFLMGEDPIVDTTEVNGNHGTVDPSVFALDGSVPSPLSKRDNLPILSYNESLAGSPAPLEFANARPESLDAAIVSMDQSVSSTAPSVEEPMDVETPRRSYAQVVIPQPPKFSPLPYSSTKTGLVYDVRMRFHCEPLSAMQNMDDIHPEDPRRIHEIYEELRTAGLVQEDNSQGLDPDFQLYRISARHATDAEICLVHSWDHYLWTKSLRDRTEEELNDMARRMDSVYLHNSTFECATLAAGGAIEACRAVVMGHVRNAIAVIRPPGHHAEHNEPGGFCFFNNVPIAAKVCQDNFPERCRKVLILDWDVHHGNGVQHAFYNDPNVLYISLHVHKDGNFYPNLPDGDHLHCGEGAGVGKNVNIPWADHGMGDGDYLLAFEHVVMPIAQEFDPDLVIISAGFDAAEGDILGGCHVTPACYAHMTHMLMSLAKGKIAVCLEGGYNLRSIAKSALAVTRTLMLEPPDRFAQEPRPTKLGVQTVELVKRQQSKYWKNMYPKQISKERVQRVGSERLHDWIRQAEAHQLFERFSMSPLFILREKISASFEKQVLATPRYFEARPLLVIFHDPPELVHLPDPLTGKIESHNTFITDVSKSYVEWAIEHDFEVIDVNIPKHVTDADDDASYVDGEDHDARASATSELATYLWENYIEPNDATQVFLMGVGAAYSGLIDLLGRHEACTEPTSPIEYVISFVAENALQSIKRPADDYIGDWYYKHSRVFVAGNHAAWDPSRRRKLRKKYGNLSESPHTNLSDMLEAHRDEVTQLLFQETEGWRKAQARLDQPAQRTTTNINNNTNAAGNLALNLNDRDLRATSVPNPMRSPGVPGLPPMSLFSVSPTPRNGPQSPRSPMKRSFQ